MLSWSLEYTNVKDYLTLYKCLFCNRNYQRIFDEILKKRFVKTYKFSSNDINKFILLLQKSFYKFEYIFLFEDFKVSNSGDYHDLYDQINTLLLADIFENFQNMSWNIWTWLCLFSHYTKISMVSSVKKGLSKIRCMNW